MKKKAVKQGRKIKSKLKEKRKKEKKEKAEGITPKSRTIRIIQEATKE